MKNVSKHSVQGGCLLLLTAALCPLDGQAVSNSAGGDTRKKLIEFGWDEPDPIFMRQHSAALRNSPFDGTVFHVNYRRADGTSGSFTWEGWGRKRFTKAELKPSIRPLRQAELGEFRNNFLRFNTTPADVDWFDDHSAILENARLAAWFARQAKCPGILFDIEQYKGKLFEYAKQRDAKTRTFEEYAAQARRRGAEVMRAFQKGYPGLTVFLTAGYSFPWGQTKRGQRPLKDVSYGLAPAFLDGMLDAAEGRTKMVDGCEAAYGYTTPAEFSEWYQIMKDGLLPVVADRTKYARHFSISFGIWMDKDSTDRGWSVDDFTKNGHTPEALERVVTKALQLADEYVWIYTEPPLWWSAPDGAPSKLPAAYEQAVRRAKAAGRGIQ